MTLTPTRVLLSEAHAAGRGIGAFNVIHLETAEALVAGAEAAGLPVILQLSENCVRYHGGFEPMARAMITVAEASTARVAVHLDHAEDVELAFRAIDAGFGSVMYDGAKLDFAQNVTQTQRVVERARSSEVLVEAELGEIGGKGGAHTPGVRTDPQEASTFVRETGVDALAVAVGSSHAMTERVAAIDLDLIGRLAHSVTVPLVLHGSSGVPDATIVSGIRAGLTKINVSTHLSAVFTTALRSHLAERPGTVDSRTYMAAGRAAVQNESARLLAVFASTEEPG